jgi:PAS domain S-box-containing protein
VHRFTLPSTAALALLLLPPGGAEAQSFNFHHLTNRDGLPQSQVLALHQGHEGYLWFGTYGGLSRFSGTTLHTYTITDGLSSNVVAAIGEDPGGGLVLGTLGGGVCIMEASVFRCISVDGGLPSPDVHNVFSDEEGVVWAATDGGLALIRDGQVTTFGPEEGLPAGPVLSVVRDRGGRILAGTPQGLFRLEEEGERPGFRAVGGPTLAGRSIRALHPWEEGVMVGTTEGLFLVREDEATPLRTGLEPLQVRDLASGADGSLWAATDRGLLHGFGDALALVTEENGLLHDDLNRVLVDREGNVWAGTDRGVSKLIPGPFRGYSVREGLPDRFVRALGEDEDGRLWVGTRGGVAVRSGDDAGFEVRIPASALTDPRIYSLARAPEGGMLVGAREGLLHWRDGFLRTFREADGLPANYVLSLLDDGEGGVWIGTESGLARWEEGRIVPFPADHPLLGLFAVSMARDREGRLWIGLAAGGVRIWDGEVLRALGAAEGLTDQVIWSLSPDPAGAMWIGTNGRGAFRVRDGEIRRVSTADGLANNFVWQVLADSRGGVWFYTNRGLDRYQEGRFQHYGIDDGLIDLEGSAGAAMEDSRSRLWFGSSAGVVSYRAEADRPNLVPPRIRIEGLSLGGRTLGPEPEIRLDSDLLQVRFEAVTFRDHEAVRYRYRLTRGAVQGETWSEPFSERTVTLGGLRPGDYTFQVTAVSGAGVSSEDPAQATFTVVPAVWQTWWFWTILFLCLTGLGASVPFLRARRLAEERARIAEALRNSESRLREIIENSTNVFYAHTADHELTYLSPQVEDVLGVPPDEAFERWTEFVTDHPVNQEGIGYTMRAIETGERQPPYDLQLRHADGREIWVRVTEAPVVRDGKVTGIVGSLTDMTVAREAEREGARLREQLNQAQKMEALGRMAGGVAHDFNNILTSILGHTDLLAAELGPGHPMRSDLDEIGAACDRATGLVAQLLAFGRKKVVIPTPVRLNEVIGNSQGMLRRVLGEDVSLEFQEAAEDPWILLDRGQLDQILLNLTLNARDALLRGGSLLIATEVARLEAPPGGTEDSDFTPGDYAVLRVADTGHGMTPEIAARVFEPFFTTKEVGEGSGLGLATVYGIVKQAGGYIELESRFGEGTSFGLWFPTTSPSEQVEAGQDGREAPAPGPDGRGKVVLVAEDEVAVRSLVRRVLEREGFLVWTAGDGFEAVRIAQDRDRSIDLLVTDMIMPGMNGKELAEKIRFLHPGVRVLYMSGYADDILGRKGIVSADVNFMEKPFDLDQLVSRVRSVLEE